MLRPLSPPRASISAYRTCDKKVYRRRRRRKCLEYGTCITGNQKKNHDTDHLLLLLHALSGCFVSNFDFTENSNRLFCLLEFLGFHHIFVIPLYSTVFTAIKKRKEEELTKKKEYLYAVQRHRKVRKRDICIKHTKCFQWLIKKLTKSDVVQRFPAHYQ